MHVGYGQKWDYKHRYCCCIDLYWYASLRCFIERGMYASSGGGTSGLFQAQEGGGELKRKAHGFRRGDLVPERNKCCWVRTTCIVSRCVVSIIENMCILLWNSCEIVMMLVIYWMHDMLCVLSTLAFFTLLYMEVYFSPILLNVIHHGYLADNQD